MTRMWDGKSVFVNKHEEVIRQPVKIDLTQETAGALANYLRKSSGLSEIFNPLPEGLVELLNALDYVLVADPASISAHRRMEAGKGMTPDGGHKEPFPHPPRDGRGFIRPEHRREGS
jgi:hypothetical protein